MGLSKTIQRETRRERQKKKGGNPEKIKQMSKSTTTQPKLHFSIIETTTAVRILFAFSKWTRGQDLSALLCGWKLRGGRGQV
jgi:hypothetical protein